MGDGPPSCQHETRERRTYMEDDRPATDCLLARPSPREVPDATSKPRRMQAPFAQGKMPRSLYAVLMFCRAKA